MFSLLQLMLVAHAAEVEGVIRAEDGSPVQGVSVYVVDDRLGYAGAVTNEEGEFAIVNLPERSYRLWVVPSNDINHPSRFAPSGVSYCEGEQLFASEAEGAPWMEVTLPAGGTANGVVLDETGSPMAGVDVELRGTDDRTAAVRRFGITDSDGIFEVVGLDSNEGEVSPYQVTYTAKGYPDQELGGVYSDGDLIDGGLGVESEVGTQQLLEGVAVEGQVLAEVGGSIPDATVYVYAEGQVETAVTDEEGLFHVPGLPAGDVLVWASHDDYALTYYPSDPEPMEWLTTGGEGSVLSDVELELPDESVLIVNLPDFGEDLSGVTALAYNESYTVGVGGAVNEAGEVEVGRLHEGRWALFVYAGDEGFVDDFIRDEEGERMLFDVDAAEVRHDVEMPRGGSVEGVVVSDSGEEIYGASIYLSPVDTRYRSHTARSEADGSFLFEELVPGEYILQVRYAVYCPEDGGYVDVWWPGEVLDTRALPITVVEGELLDGVTIEAPEDMDHDGMGDRWEEQHGLQVGLDDGGGDLDGDGFTNLEEYLLGSDPSVDLEEETGCSCSSGDTRGGGLAAALVALGLVWRRRESFK